MKKLVNSTPNVISFEEKRLLEAVFQRLVEAVFENDLPTIRFLFARNSFLVQDIDTFCKAIAWGRSEVVMLFIERGVNLNMKNRDGYHPLHMACESRVKNLFDVLVEHGSDPTRADGLPFRAAFSGRTDILRYLHSSGFDLSRDHEGCTPIEGAVGMGNLPTVEFLLSVNVEVSIIDTSKRLKPWKGAYPDSSIFDEIRNRIIEYRNKKND